MKTPHYLTSYRIRMPFGKYIGVPITEIPLRYLDETISVMPPTWLVRKVQKLVDEAMEFEYFNDPSATPGNRTAFEIISGNLVKIESNDLS